MLWKIISILKISGNWLIGEDGDMDIQPIKKAPTDNLGKSDFQKKKLIHNYDKLNQTGKDKLIEYSDDLNCNPKYTDVESDSQRHA